MSEIRYQTDLEGISAENLDGPFFVGWLDPPTPETHLRVLEAATHKVLAIDGGKVVGFASAISDGILTAYVPLVEVAEAYQGRGIGTEIVNRLVVDIGDLYFVDLITDEDIVPFYAELGFKRVVGVARRNYSMQAGRPIASE